MDTPVTLDTGIVDPSGNVFITNYRNGLSMLVRDITDHLPVFGINPKSFKPFFDGLIQYFDNKIKSLIQSSQSIKKQAKRLKKIYRKIVHKVSDLNPIGTILESETCSNEKVTLIFWVVDCIAQTLEEFTVQYSAYLDLDASSIVWKNVEPPLFSQTPKVVLYRHTFMRFNMAWNFIVKTMEDVNQILINILESASLPSLVTARAIACKGNIYDCLSALTSLQANYLPDLNLETPYAAIVDVANTTISLCAQEFGSQLTVYPDQRMIRELMKTFYVAFLKMSNPDFYDTTLTWSPSDHPTIYAITKNAAELMESDLTFLYKTNDQFWTNAVPPLKVDPEYVFRFQRKSGGLPLVYSNRFKKVVDTIKEDNDQGSKQQLLSLMKTLKTDTQTIITEVGYIIATGQPFRKMPTDERTWKLVDKRLIKALVRLLGVIQKVKRSYLIAISK